MKTFIFKEYVVVLETYHLCNITFPFQFEIHKRCYGDYSEECNEYYYSDRGIIHVPKKAEQQGVGCNVHDGKLKSHICSNPCLMSE